MSTRKPKTARKTPTKIGRLHIVVPPFIISAGPTSEAAPDQSGAFVDELVHLHATSREEAADLLANLAKVIRAGKSVDFGRAQIVLGISRKRGG